MKEAKRWATAKTSSPSTRLTCGVVVSSLRYVEGGRKSNSKVSNELEMRYYNKTNWLGLAWLVPTSVSVSWPGGMYQR